MNSSPFLDLAMDLAKKGGAVMRKNFSLNMKKEWKEDNSPVTETDIEVNRLVLDIVRSAYPEHSILSEEEESDFTPESEYVWICDPVDGTHNFSHGIPTATFALALTKNGEPELGVIYDPFLDRMFYAEKGKGAYMNGTRLHVSESPTLKKTLVGMGKMKNVRNLFPVMEAAREHGAIFITGLSIHFMTALVAAGEFSASFFGGTTVHDMTAGTILVEEAGGKTSDLFGRRPDRFDRDFEGQLCSNGLLHDQLLEIMDRVSPKAETEMV
jgi:myo-inositol-1(or 4)-monophosphatase